MFDPMTDKNFRFRAGKLDEIMKLRDLNNDEELAVYLSTLHNRMDAGGVVQLRKGAGVTAWHAMEIAAKEGYTMTLGALFIPMGGAAAAA